MARDKEHLAVNINDFQIHALVTAFLLMQSMSCTFNLNRMFNIRSSFHVTSAGWMDADWQSVRRFTTGHRSCWIDSEIDTFHILTVCTRLYRRLCARAGEKVMKWAVLWAFSRAWYRNSGPSKKVSASQDTECIWNIYFFKLFFSSDLQRNE